MAHIDLNCDLGEGAPFDEQLLELASSASIACGFHAGDPALMARTVEAALRLGVTIGAHPSYNDREGFGRRAMRVDTAQLEAELIYQIGALRSLARSLGAEVAFLKPHGALYNQAAADPGLAAAVVRAAIQPDWRLPLLCPADSALSRAAAGAGLEHFGEGFADRVYATDGSLLPRDRPGAVLADADAVARQAVALAHGRASSGEGTPIELAVSSICIHGDSPSALTAARAVRAALDAEGFVVESFLRP
jgi:UPF0271 protein